jgi:outer membrane receptor for ferrienterochelin and colicins
MSTHGFKASNAAAVLTGVLFQYSNQLTTTKTTTDLTLQDKFRFSKNGVSTGQQITLSPGRYFYEQMGRRIAMEKKNMSGTEFMVKAFTKRLLGAYELYCRKNVVFDIRTDQNSIYGDMPYLDNTVTGQLTWDKEIVIMICFFGTALRYQYYDDNTTATVKKILIGFRSLCADNHLNDKHKFFWVHD